jgi:predicted nicotinamide N-methyase
MNKKLKPGNKIAIRINGKTIITEIDEKGRQRLPKNRLVRFAVDQGEVLNTIWTLKGTAFSEEEVREFYQSFLGCSIEMYADIFPGDEIENPLWNDEHEDA